MNIAEITTQPQLIAVSRLERSPLNARRTIAKMGMDELKASLLAHGLMQNLVVTDAGDGTFRVIAGGRRLEAIRSLQAESKLPEDFAVPCQVVSEDHAMEMSLAENTIRLAMHPADQFEAFAALIDQGQTAAEVAQRFGIDESLVLKRMKLARVAPELLQKYREEQMTLECLVAFTITDDHRRQLKVYKSLQDWQRDEPSVIRDALTEKMIDASSKMAQFVGVDAYLAAGGTSRSDLFSKEVYFEKPTLLNRLAEKKLDSIRQELEAEGWGWIEINPERDYDLINRCTRIRPQLVDAPSDLIELKSELDAELEAIGHAIEDSESDELIEQQDELHRRLEEVEEQLAAFVGFDAEHKPLAGCFVSIAQDGTPFIDKGLVRPEHRKQLARLLNPDGNDGDTTVRKQKGGMPESLRRDLAIARLHATQAELAKHPLIALDLLTFQAAVSAFHVTSTVDALEVQFRRPRLHGSREADRAASEETLAAYARALPLDWLNQPTEAARFEAFRLLPDAARLDILACCVALTMKPKLAPDDGIEPTAYDAALSLTGGKVADYWRPGKDNFLKRITRDQLLSIGRLVLGDTWSQSHCKDNKASLVDQLDRAFGNPEKSGRTPEQVEKLKRWLPDGMAFELAANPQPRKPKKRKAA